MLDKRAGNKKRIRNDIIGVSFDGSVSIAKGDIMDLIAVFAVAVERDRALEALQDNIGNMEIIFSKGEMKVEMV